MIVYLIRSKTNCGEYLNRKGWSGPFTSSSRIYVQRDAADKKCAYVNSRRYLPPFEVIPYLLKPFYGSDNV
jgi:hypothetical protein